RADRTDCLGNSCMYRGECHFFRARSKAREADVLILNHHLLISGLQVKDILPGAGILIIDEGHRMEDAASDCLGLTITESMLISVFDELGFSDLEVEKKAKLLDLARQLSNAIAGLMEGYTETVVWHSSEHTEKIEKVISLATEIADGVRDIEDLATVHQTVLLLVQTASKLVDISEEEFCTFIEVSNKRTILRSVPLSVGKSLKNIIYTAFDTTILTSATLTAGGKFDFYSNRLGTYEADTECFGSPFNFAEQGVLAIPSDLPVHDSHVELTSMVWYWGRKLAEVLDGRTMLLFTSYRNLQLVRKLAENDLPPGIKLYVQGDMSRGAILDNFRTDSRAIVLGTASFWEGVDLPGDILRAIIIDRLPFSSPGHPLIQARLEQMEKSGGSSFRQYSLPLASVRLKQGTGRLIRSLNDTGAVMIMDKRILTRNYGSMFLKTIQQFRMVECKDVIPFLQGGNIDSSDQI
ncbi:MAG: hypothetical protein H8D05_00250, partial [FCB group bacterium]|nr:hypothetical protein [FCB group bacterium]